MIDQDLLEIVLQAGAGGFAIWTFGRLAMRVIELGASVLTQIPPALNTLKESYSGLKDAINQINKTLEETNTQKGKLTLAVNTQGEILAQNTLGLSAIKTDLEGVNSNLTSLVKDKDTVLTDIRLILEDKNKLKGSLSEILLGVQSLNSRLEAFEKIITLADRVASPPGSDPKPTEPAQPEPMIGPQEKPQEPAA